jgi:Protein of unknown function (DUF1571)
MFHFFRPHRRRCRTTTAHCCCTKRWDWLRPVALGSVLAGVSSLGGLMPEVSVPSFAAAPQLVQPARPQPQTAAPQESPLDTPLRMAAEARQMYAQVRDYQGILITQERIKGMMQPEEVIQLNFRKEPFSVYMKWLQPKDKAGQEVSFVSGKNQNMMRVLAASGFGRGLGWLNIAIDSPKVKEHSRHVITETGFGNLIDRCEKGWADERPLNKNVVQIAEYEYNQRRCMRVEATHTDRDTRFYCYRTAVYFDKQTKLPVRMECYDWPRPGGPPEGELMECFSYIHLDFNVNLPDSTFNK